MKRTISRVHPELPVPSEPRWAQRDVVVPTWYLHFTDAASASAIAASGELWLSATITNAVFAAAVGARQVPSVQYSSRRAPANEVRTHAVRFATDEVPDRIFPEEVVWHRTAPLAVHDVEVLTADAADALLDNSLGIPEDGWWHTRDCVCVPCQCWAQTNGW